MECENTETLIRNAALMKLNELAEHLDFLAMKIETVKLGFETANIGLKTFCNKEEKITEKTAVLKAEEMKKLMLPPETVDNENRQNEHLEAMRTVPAVLMLPAPAKKMGGKNKLCPVCKKWCKKGEETHERCKETRKE